MSDTTQIQTLIERWAKAVHSGDLDGVLADHSDDIVSLDVVAGADVAFAYALLRCGTPEELTAAPGTRLRLTLGLRKEQGRWVVGHEHHSFPADD
jgi:ketosteroid isomerase-like protein